MRKRDGPFFSFANKSAGRLHDVILPLCKAEPHNLNDLLSKDGSDLAKLAHQLGKLSRG